MIRGHWITTNYSKVVSDQFENFDRNIKWNTLVAPEMYYTEIII